MTAKKYNSLDTDTTLGGNNASDNVISSQKAVKTYIDDHSGGGGSTYTAGTGIDITNDVISVTSTISNGAAAGATAVQPADLVAYTANEVQTLWDSI